MDKVHKSPHVHIHLTLLRVFSLVVNFFKGKAMGGVSYEMSGVS